MKVGIIVPKSRPFVGGGNTYTETILEALLKAKSRHELVVFASGPRSFESNAGFTFVDIDKAFGEGTGRISLSEVLRQHQIEVVWFLSVLILHEKIEIPYIMPVWDLQHRLQPYFPEVSIAGWDWESRENYYRSILPRAAYILTGTEAGRNEINQFYQIPRERIKVVPFVVPSQVYGKHEISGDDRTYMHKHSTLFGENRKKYLFYPAQFWPHKNHIAILLALKILREKYHLDFSVVFTGSDHGNKRYIRESALDLELTENIHFLGFVSSNLLTQLYKNSFALVFPSFFGPDNLPPLEAFALGCPVIASDVPGAAEQLGDAAILINPKSETEIADAIRELHSNTELRQVLIKRGHERAAALKPEGYIERVISLLDEFASIRRCWSGKVTFRYLIPEKDLSATSVMDKELLINYANDFIRTKEFNQIKGLIDKHRDLVHEDPKLLELLNAIESVIADAKRVNNIGEQLFSAGDIEGAKNAFLTVMDICSDSISVCNNLAVLYWKTGDLETALKYFERALAIDPFDRASVFNLCTVLTELGQSESTVKVLKNYLGGMPDDEEARELLMKLEDIRKQAMQAGG